MSLKFEILSSLLISKNNNLSTYVISNIFCCGISLTAVTYIHVLIKFCMFYSKFKIISSHGTTHIKHDIVWYKIYTIQVNLTPCNIVCRISKLYITSTVSTVTFVRWIPCNFRPKRWRLLFQLFRVNFKSKIYGVLYIIYHIVPFNSMKYGSVTVSLTFIQRRGLWACMQ